MLNLIDEFTRECLAIRVDRKLNSTDVIDVLADQFILRGVPGHIRSDNGPEFIAKAVREWIAAVGARTAFIEPGSPWENGYCESFNSKLRDELLERRDLLQPRRGARSSSRAGAGTTTPGARTHRWAIGRQLPRSCSGRLRQPEPLRRPPQPWRQDPSCTKTEPGPPDGGRPPSASKEFAGDAPPERRVFMPHYPLDRINHVLKVIGRRRWKTSRHRKRGQGHLAIYKRDFDRSEVHVRAA